MDIQVLAVELLAETLHVLHHFLRLLGIGERDTSVDINRQLALLVQLVQTLIDALVKCLALRKTCVEDNGHASLYRIVYPAQKLCIDLLICYFQIIEEHVPTRRLECVSSHMAVFTYKITEFGHTVGCLVGNAVPVKYLGVHPDAMAFALQNQQFGIGADGIQVFLHDVISIQAFTLQNKPVTFQARITLDAICHKVQRLLFAGAEDVFPRIHIGESDAGGHMHMAVNDAWHDELATKVDDLSLVC